MLQYNSHYAINSNEKNEFYIYLLTAESLRIVVIGDRMFFKSHTLTVRSSLPDTKLSPPANTAVVTCLQKMQKRNYYTEMKL